LAIRWQPATRHAKTGLAAARISTRLRYIRQYIEAQNGEAVIFSWQGGEPTMLGLDFFRDIVALQVKYKAEGRRIENDLQTNGTLLTDEWCQFLKQHGFLADEMRQPWARDFCVRRRCTDICARANSRSGRLAVRGHSVPLGRRP
jgi:hypothetical protein